MRKIIRSFSNKANKTYELVLIRHGKTPDNERNTYCGWNNAELTSDGVEGAILAGKKLVEIGFIPDILHISPLKRAQETATNILKGLNLEIKTETHYNIVEQHTGVFTGEFKTPERKEIIAGPYSKAADIIPSHPYYGKILQAIDGVHSESRFDVEKRTNIYFKEIAKPLIKEGKKILAVTHSNAVKGILKNAAQNLIPDQGASFEIGNTELIKLDFYINEEEKLICSNVTNLSKPNSITIRPKIIEFKLEQERLKS